MKIKNSTGFTLIELMVVISIIGLLSAVVYANFNDARAQSRDKVRMTSLKEVQLALEFYKAQNGGYPPAGCSVANTNFAGPGTASVSGLTACSAYITGLVPDFISALPTDPNQESIPNKGFYYRSNGTSYKLMAYDVVEKLTITSAGDEFARCPAVGGGCASIPVTTYAVYSAGAETW
jgi:prepilin-type N-terminal cleavage/methylation domain-containing protein